MIRLRVKEIIQEKNINQSQLSRMADIPINTIQSMVRNAFHDPRTIYIRKTIKCSRSEDTRSLRDCGRKNGRITKKAAHQLRKNSTVIDSTRCILCPCSHKVILGEPTLIKKSRGKIMK